MNKAIPLNSLVFCQNPDRFPSHECLSKASVEWDLTGARSLDQTIGFAELRHRVQVKLSIGERAVVSGPLTADEKHKLSLLASQLGLPVVDADAASIPVLPDVVLSDWNGITVVGDLHGDLKAFQDAAQWARSRQHFMLLLGDVIDYGPKSLETMTAVYRAVMAGDATMLLGNHERKIARWLNQRDNGKVYLRLSDGNRVTTQALERLNHARQQQWIGQFRSLLSHAQTFSVMKDMTFAHAAVHPSHWSARPDLNAIEKFAVNGEAEHKDGKYIRSHQWIDDVPKDQTVIVGHEIMHPYPLVKTGAKGGHIVFLDTGCGKGGRLSSADLRFSGSDLRLECFKMY